MANSYTVTPGVILGDARITGDLIVEGRTFQLGALARKFRIQENALGDFVTSVNKDVVAVTNDDAGINSINTRMRDVSREHDLSSSFPGIGIPGVADFIASATLVRALRTFQAWTATAEFGSGTRKLRIQEIADGDYRLSVNLDELTDTQDDPAQSSVVLQLADFARQFLIFSQDAGVPTINLDHLVTRQDRIEAFGTPILTGFADDFTFTNHTGTVVETTLRTLTIPGGSLATNRGLLVVAAVTGLVQGGAGSTIRVRYGGSVINSMSKTALANLLFLTHLGLSAAGQLQVHRLEWDGLTLAVNTTLVLAKDASVDQPLEFTIQLGAVGDAWRAEMWKVFGLPRAP